MSNLREQSSQDAFWTHTFNRIPRYYVYRKKGQPYQKEMFLSISESLFSYLKFHMSTKEIHSIPNKLRSVVENVSHCAHL